MTESPKRQEHNRSSSGRNTENNALMQSEERLMHSDDNSNVQEKPESKSDHIFKEEHSTAEPLVNTQDIANQVGTETHKADSQLDEKQSSSPQDTVALKDPDDPLSAEASKNTGDKMELETDTAMSHYLAADSPTVATDQKSDQMNKVSQDSDQGNLHGGKVPDLSTNPHHDNPEPLTEGATTTTSSKNNDGASPVQNKTESSGSPLAHDVPPPKKDVKDDYKAPKASPTDPNKSRGFSRAPVRHGGSFQSSTGSSQASLYRQQMKGNRMSATGGEVETPRNTNTKTKGQPSRRRRPANRADSNDDVRSPPWGGPTILPPIVNSWGQRQQQNEGTDQNFQPDEGIVSTFNTIGDDSHFMY